MEEEETLVLLIEKALAKARDDHKTRGMALAITKLEEAKFWHGEHFKEIRTAADRVGFTKPQS